jgi:hypothetical protein
MDVMVKGLGMKRMSRERKIVVLTATPVIVALIGTGVLVYSTRLRNQEMAINEELSLEVAALRGSLSRLEKSLTNLEALPPLAGPGSEKYLIALINSSADRAGVKVVSLVYSVQAGETDPALGVIDFSLEGEGGEEPQARCLAILQESVTGIKLGTIDGLIGGEGSSLFGRLQRTRLYSDKMKITGRVFFESGDSSR